MKRVSKSHPDAQPSVGHITMKDMIKGTFISKEEAEKLEAQSPGCTQGTIVYGSLSSSTLSSPEPSTETFKPLSFSQLGKLFNTDESVEVFPGVRIQRTELVSEPGWSAGKTVEVAITKALSTPAASPTITTSTEPRIITDKAGRLCWVVEVEVNALRAASDPLKDSE